MFLKTIKARFYLITGFLIALACIEYFEITAFIGNFRKSSETARTATALDKDIQSLEKSFWKLRFWEKTMSTESHPDAEKQFGKATENLKKKLSDFDPDIFSGRFSGKTVQINNLIAEYHSAFDQLIQLKTDQSVNLTQIHSDYRVLTSTILANDETGFIKPLYNLNRFMESYLQKRRDSAYRAFEIVFTLLRKNLSKSGMMDERIQSYAVNLERFMETDFTLEKKIRKINDRFDVISIDLTNLFADMAQTAKEFSAKATSAQENLYETLQHRFLWVSGIVFGSLLTIIGLIAGTIIRPIRRLSQIVIRIKSGERNVRFTSRIGDEIAELGFAFNEMLDIIKFHRDNLEELIEKRTAELNETLVQLKNAKEKSEMANRAKSEFLANMSHEIRTPMNSIMGFADILEEKIRDEQHRHYLSLIRAGGRSLLTLINDILDLSKIEAGKMKLEYEAVNPIFVFREIAGVFSQKIEEKGLKFFLETDSDLPEYLLLDEVRLRQILLNLVGNAVKFTESGSVGISVQVLVHEETPDTVDFIFSVRDTGIGIPEEQRKTVFKAFEQQSGQDHATYGGTGLGLAITRRLAEMMGGNIRVSGEKGGGSVFTVTLRNVRKVKGSDVPEKKNGISADSVIFDKAVILIADDITENRMLLLGYLEDCGFEFIEAEDGQRAADLARDRHPDLILMDMKMPVTDGREATKIIRAGHETKDIPIIAVTASAMKEDEEEISALCDGYLRKPVKKAELIAELARFLKHSAEEPVPGDTEQAQSEEESESAPHTPDPETLERLPELIRILETEFMPRWEEISDMLIMDDARQFAEDLDHAGREYDLRLITDFCCNLQKNVESYDVVGVKKRLAEFPGIVEQTYEVLKTS